MVSGRVPGSVRLLVSTSSAVRLQHAEAFLLGCPSDQDLLVVASSRSAADDLARRAASSRPASFGWHRMSVLQLAARLGLPVLAAQRRLPGSPLGAEAVASRAIFGAIADDALTYFGPVAHTPGFPRAVARTVGEMRMAGVAPIELERCPPAGRDLAALMSAIDAELATSGAADRALLLGSAVASLEQGRQAALDLVAGRPLVLLDPVAVSMTDLRFLAALVAAAGSALITMPAGDAAASDLAQRVGIAVEPVAEAGEAGTIGRLRTHLFTTGAVPVEGGNGDVQVFSAPGEGREAVEIARRVLTEASRGISFDQMAILVRAPQQYLGLLEHALARAEVPAWFDRGTRRPDPARRVCQRGASRNTCPWRRYPIRMPRRRLLVRSPPTTKHNRPGCSTRWPSRTRRRRRCD
jgi:hypothetical protein